MLSYWTLVTGSFNGGSFMMKFIVTDYHDFSGFSISYGLLLMCVLCLFHW